MHATTDSRLASTTARWQLARGQALRRVAPGGRLLRVACGRLWVTRDGQPGAPAEDLVLQRGDTLPLAGGEAVVLEAFEDSAFEWLDPAPTRPSAA